MVGIIPSLWDGSVVAVDSQSSSVYPIVLLNLAYFDGSSCEPNYQQRTVVMTQQEFNALTQQMFNAFSKVDSSVPEPHTNITEVGYSCYAQVDGYLTAYSLSLLEGEPQVFHVSDVMAKYAQNSPFIHMMVVGYVVSMRLSLNNRLPMKITDVTGTAENLQAATSFQEIYCAPACTFNANLTFPNLGASASSTNVTVRIDTEIPVGWGLPPVWSEILWLPITYQTSVSIGGGLG